MKTLLFLILFLNSTVLLSQIKIVCEYNSEWKYRWYHDNVSLGIETNVMYSIGNNVAGNYLVVITNKCDTSYQEIYIKNPKDNSVYHFKDINIALCKQTLFDENWYTELESELSFIIFPNPAQNLLNFRVYRGYSASYNIKIYDYFGRKIIEEELTGDGQIDITRLAKGTYVFVVTSEKATKSKILSIH